MGCDIHFYVEKWDKYTNRWISADKWIEETEGEGESARTYMARSWRDELFGTRNYRLFALLANVRNDGSITPISQPRGLPEDVSKFVKMASDRYAGDGHSHSYLTLAELKGHKWDEHADYTREFLDVVMPNLEKIRDGIHIPSGEKLYEADRGNRDVRIVFWFDN